MTITNYDLLRALRDLPDGCTACDCDLPVMMLVRPTPPDRYVYGVCQRHVWQGPCIDDAIDHYCADARDRCTFDVLNLIPLTDLLDELGVMR